MKKIIDKLEQKLGLPGLVARIATNLSGSELNTFLLYLFHLRSKLLSPSLLLQQYCQNRFTLPASVEPIKYKEDELFWLKSANLHGFEPVLLSPLTPFGTSSVVGYVAQNNIISALRGLEVVSDATNVLALKIAQELRQTPTEQTVVLKQYCATHRHVRGQYYHNPAFSAHFGVFCLVSGGLNPRDPSFPLSLVKTHLSFYFEMLLPLLATEDLSLEVYLPSNTDSFSRQAEHDLRLLCQDLDLDLKVQALTNPYYQLLQFKLFLHSQQLRIDLADGGFVDWTQKLLANQKQKLFISAVGLELLHKIHHGLLQIH